MAALETKCPHCGGLVLYDKVFSWKGLEFCNSGEHYLLRWQNHDILWGDTITKILYHLARCHERVLSREYLYAQIYTFDCDVQPKTLNVFMLKLRKTLLQAKLPFTIFTVWGRGWKLMELSNDD